MKRIPREIKAAYPYTGTGYRQGERVARYIARSWSHPFAASNKCIERIRAALQRGNES